MLPAFFCSNLHDDGNIACRAMIFQKGVRIFQKGVRIFQKGVRIFQKGVRVLGNTGTFLVKCPVYTRQCMFKFKNAGFLHGEMHCEASV